MSRPARDLVHGAREDHSRGRGLAADAHVHDASEGAFRRGQRDDVLLQPGSLVRQSYLRVTMSVALVCAEFAAGGRCVQRPGGEETLSVGVE